MLEKLPISNHSGIYCEKFHCLSQNRSGNIHAFILDTDQGLILIDTLWDTDARPVLDALESLGKSIRDLKHIILTHAHRSHIGGVAALKNLSGARVYAHEWEADIIAGERKAQCVPLFPRLPLQAYPMQFGLALGLMPHEPCEVDQFLRHGDSVGPLQVIHTPGHSPGHLALYWPEEKALFAGDALVTWPDFALGWPGLTLNAAQHQRSLHDLVDLDANIIAVGHGKPATGEETEVFRRMIRSARAA